MRLGTIAVREALPPSTNHITDKEIQESLWHYYYDVEKSVAYLVSKHIAKPKAQKKAPTQKKVQGALFSYKTAVDTGCEVRGHAGGGLPFARLNSVREPLLMMRLQDMEHMALSRRPRLAQDLSLLRLSSRICHGSIPHSSDMPL